MSHYFYAIKSGQHRGIYWSQNSFVRQCPRSHPELFYTFHDAYYWIMDIEHYAFPANTDNYCPLNYSNGGIQLVFTDGAAFGNGQNCEKAGYGVYWGRGHQNNIYAALIDQRLTNGRAELMPAIVATQQIIEKAYGCNDNFVIYTDSTYVKTCFENMLEWKYDGWRLRDRRRTAKNIDYLERWIGLLDQNGILDRITVEYVRGHQNDNGYLSNGNNMADWMANRGAEMCQQ